VKAAELRDMTGEELRSLMNKFQEDIMHFRMQQATGVVENVRASRQTKRNIARIHTILRERELVATKGSK
jgi:large subunit ribosomal protein L29